MSIYICKGKSCVSPCIIICEGANGKRDIPKKCQYGYLRGNKWVFIEETTRLTNSKEELLMLLKK